jgi:cold shock CspA family protein
MSISSYITQNISFVSHPYNPVEVIKIPDVSVQCRLLERFLAIPENQNFAHQLVLAVQDHQEWEYGDQVRRTATLKTLVGTIEPFLKAIGRIRYTGDLKKLEYLEKQKCYGLLKDDLVLPNKWDTLKINDNHCPIYWTQQNCLAAVSYRVYLLRNEFSHEAPDYTVDEISKLFNTVLGLFILIIRYPANHSVLELATSPYRTYLKKVSQIDTEYERYVNLQASLKWKPNSREDLPFSLEETESFFIQELPIEEEISILVKQVKKIILIGGGGSGKSRTLKHITALLAKEIISLESEVQKIPIYLRADVLGNGNKISTYLSIYLKDIDSVDIKSSLSDGKYWLFIDGLNEVPFRYYSEVIQDIKSFLISYPKCKLVISTRQETYHNELQLPVYELEPLNPYTVGQILRLNARTEDEGNKLFSALKNDNKLLALFKTPLMSRLLCELPTQIHIPRNIGEMMQVLFNQIFEREKIKGDQISQRIKIMVLVELAQTIRKESGTAISENQILYLFENVTQRFARQEVSPDSLLTKLIDSSILQKSGDSLIGFFHETALDYFTAIGLKDAWEKNTDVEIQANIMDATPISIEILSGLLSNADTLTQLIAQHDLKLAARCYSARSQRSAKLFQELSNEAKNRLFTDPILALDSLAALDEIEATQTIFQALSKLPHKKLLSISKIIIKYAPNGIKQEVNKALLSGGFEQKLVAIQFINAHQLVEFSSDIIALAELNQSNLVEEIAKALGSLESPEALNYLEQQCNTPIDSRSIPLALAINYLSSERAENVIKLGLRDLDVEVRRAAISKIETINICDIDTEIFDIFVTDLDFLTRLILTPMLLSRTDKSRHKEIIKGLFAVVPSPEESLPYPRIMRVVSLLHQDELEEMALQVLCTRNPSLQSIAVSKILSRNPDLAINLFDLVNFEDPEISSGAKAAIIKAVITTGNVNTYILEKAMSPLLSPGVRVAVVEMLEDLPADIGNMILQQSLVDPAEQVTLRAAKVLLSVTKFCSEEIVEKFLFHPKKNVQKQIWHIINKKSIFANSQLLEWTNNNYSTYLRARAIEELCLRKFIWNLQTVCNFVHDNNYDIRQKGYRILEAMFRDASEYIGQIKDWNIERGFGFIIKIDTKNNKKQTIFVHLSNLIDRYYTPSRNDLVTFHLDESNQTKKRAVQVRFLC